MIMRPKVVPYWRKCWRMYSVHAITALGSLGALSSWMPIVREFVPGWAYLALMGLGVTGALVRQACLNGGCDNESEG
jgi:hypothetical protein